MFYVYLLKSLLCNQFYTGSTNDLKKRMKDHNLGKVFSTKKYMPWKLLYYEAYLFEKLARIREQKLKHHGNALRQVKQRIGIYENSAGFTLIELLTSIVVLVAIGSIIAGLISFSLRGSNKTNTMESIRQAGNYALSQMSKDITYAQPFDGRNTGFNGTIINGETTYSTSCPISHSLNVITVRSSSGNDIVTQYSCNSPALTVTTTRNGVTSAPTSLINNTVSVNLTNCSFTCTQDSTGVPIIGISFSLEPFAQNGLVENSNSAIVFKTSVTMRNYKK
jgi:putative endonuclease